MDQENYEFDYEYDWCSIQNSNKFDHSNSKIEIITKIDSEDSD